MKINKDRKLRILFLAQDKFPPFRVDIAVLFGKKIVERGHKIDWILQSEETLDSGCKREWHGSTVWVGPTDNGTSKLCRVRKNLYRVLNDLKVVFILREYNYDYLIVRDRFISALIALIAAKISKVRLVYWLSFPFPEFYLYESQEGTARYPYFYWLRGHFLRFLLYKVILPSAEHIFVQTQQMKDNLMRCGVPGEKMTSVLMGISAEDIPFFGYETKNNGAGEKAIVYLGTLGKVRKMDLLIRAFKKVLDKDENARLYLVGGGEDDSDEQILKAEAARLNIQDKVLITGFLPQKKAWDYVKGAEVCVSPIRPSPILDCGSPTKLIEYMAMGKATVANDHPEQRQVIEESNAGICVPWDEDAFAKAILYLFENRGKAKAMGGRGREYVERNRNYEHLADIVEQKLLCL